MSTYQLPYQDRRGFTNCLLSAIGGDGANMAAKLLFKIAAEELNLDGAYDAKYGSEKKGTPTDVSLRLCNYGTPVRESGPTNRAHILCVFRENLIRALSLNRGLFENATVIVNTCKTPEAIRDVLQLHSGTIYVLDAANIALDTHSRLNMPMMAVLAHVLNFPEAAVVKKIKETWPRAVEPNVAAYQAAVGQIISRHLPLTANIRWSTRRNSAEPWATTICSMAAPSIRSPAAPSAAITPMRAPIRPRSSTVMSASTAAAVIPCAPIRAPSFGKTGR